MPLQVTCLPTASILKIGGNFECEGSVVAHTSTSISDINQKENIKIINDSLDKLNQINGYTFDWKRDGTSSAGIVAQEVETVLPEIVTETQIRDSEKFKGVNYDGLVGLLVEAVKELDKKVKLLENK